MKDVLEVEVGGIDIEKAAKKRRTAAEIKESLQSKIAAIDAKEKERSKKLLENSLVCAQAFAGRYPTSAAGKLATQAAGILAQALKSDF